MIQIADTTIRKAIPDDAAEIANVHLNSWRGDYRNLLPQDFRDQLPLDIFANQSKVASSKF